VPPRYVVPVERFERLDFADRWLADAFRVLQRNPPGFTLYLDVDMTRAQQLMEELRGRGLRVTYTAILLRAAALALVRHPELHQLMVGTSRVWPERIDIGMSVANEAFAAPVLRIEDAGGKDLPTLSEELRVRVPEIRKQDTEILQQLRRWGWLVPLGWLRRLLLRMFFGLLPLRRKLAGSLALTVLPNVDVVVPYLFTAPAILAMGRVADRVVAHEGLPAVRRTAKLSCTADHKVWDGQRAATFLAEVGRIVESGEFLEGLGTASHATPDRPLASAG
jgi:pyruvate dehydrogenase E2 component (dihydrolipoamide acetyltransferase)